MTSGSPIRPRRYEWLPPQPITPSPHGGYTVNGTHVPQTFEAVVNTIASRGTRLPRRISEVRYALAQTLRRAHCPALQDQEPWTPTDPRFRPHLRSIAPLLAHPLWQSGAVIAAPYLLHSPRHQVAGSIDVIMQMPDDSLLIAAIYCSRKNDRLLPHVRAELGGFIAALIDNRILFPDHAVAAWAGPGETIVEYHHPDACLGRWVDAVDHCRLSAALQAGRGLPSPPSPHALPARNHPSADPSRGPID